MLAHISSTFAEITVTFVAVGATTAPLLKRLKSGQNNEELRTLYVSVLGIFLMGSTMGIWFAKADSTIGRLITSVLAALTLVMAIPQARVALRQRKYENFHSPFTEQLFLVLLLH